MKFTASLQYYCKEAGYFFLYFWFHKHFHYRLNLLTLYFLIKSALLLVQNSYFKSIFVYMKVI